MSHDDRAASRPPASAEDRCQGSSLWGWSPAPLPADSQLKRRVDRMMPRTGLPVAVFFAAVVGLLNLAPLLPLRAELAVDGLAALAGGGWCTTSFWRCRHAHCLITGAGWLALSVFVFIEAVVGDSFIGGDEQLVLLAVLVSALLFEAAWYLARGTNAVGRSLHDRRITTAAGR